MKKYMKYISLMLVTSIMMIIVPMAVFAKENNAEVFTDSEGYTYKLNEDRDIVTVQKFDPNGNFVDSTTVNNISGKITIKKVDGQTELSDISDYV